MLVQVRKAITDPIVKVASPEFTKEFIKDMTSNFPKIHFDFHAHNDYDLSVANVIVLLIQLLPTMTSMNSK